MKYLFLVLLFSLSANANSYGSLLLEGNCTTCHHKTKSISAPSLKIVVTRYKEAFSEKKEFVSYMSSWVLKPKEETSIMLDMIKKYELMPELGYDKDTLEIISSYLYDMKFNEEN
ncbi:MULTISPECIES: cytochrome C [Arcobacteraceae]|uniref:cytochrome C n=1 Tax=Arcobacteraceae TaxID=2808963 RepID=UPI00215A0782|nr:MULTISPECIES: cytochrome C [unclassified Arcobacter]